MKKDRKAVIKRRRIVFFISSILLLLGISVIVGTAGASDINSISITQIVIQLIVGLIISAIGTFGFWLLDSTVAPKK